MSLEKKLERVVVSFTDKVLYFPGVSSRPHTEYPDYYRWKFPPNDTLFVATAERNETQIKESVYHGLTGNERKKLHHINDNDRYTLHWLYKENEEHIKRLQKPYR